MQLAKKKDTATRVRNYEQKKKKNTINNSKITYVHVQE